MDWKANTSNNTVYADNKGNIAYWHGNFVPIRDQQLNWAQPVDGSIAATEWKGLHPVEETVHLFNPKMAGCKTVTLLPFQYLETRAQKKKITHHIWHLMEKPLEELMRLELYKKEVNIL